MKHNTFIATILVLVCCVTSATAINGLEPIPVFPEPYGYGGNLVSMGWYDSTQAWFICTATNNIRYTRGLGFGQDFLVLAPKLSSALVPRVPGGDIAARPLYLVTNFQNPPVFSAAPGQPLYSALWQVFTVTWLPGVTPRPICNAEPASPANPGGLPGPGEATIVATDVVVDCPILALGPLTRPFPTNGSGYLIPQGSVGIGQTRFIFLPAWEVYCQNPITKRVEVAIAQITDVSDPALASVLGANLAPGLLNLPDEDTSDFFVMRGPKPPSQRPLVSDCPNFPSALYGRQNINYDYSPVMRYIILRRDLPPSALVSSLRTLQFLISIGCLDVVKDDQRMNVNVLVAG